MKNKYVAGILAILLGDLGIHKFYLGKLGWGIVYLLFCWTGIPAIVGLIEGIIYLCTDDDTFQVKYCGTPVVVSDNAGNNRAGEDSHIQKDTDIAEGTRVDETPVEDVPFDNDDIDMV